MQLLSVVPNFGCREERTLPEELPPSDWPVDMSGGHFLDCSPMKECDAVSGSSISRQAGAGLYKKVVDLTLNKLVSSFPLWFPPCNLK